MGGRAVVAAACLCLASCATVCHWIERPEAEFESYGHAVAAGGGYIPDFLPRSSTDIRLIHDIDTNDAWVGFRFVPGDTQSVEDACRASAASETQFPGRPSPRGHWWPGWLVQRSDKVPPTFMFFACERTVVLGSGALRTERPYLGFVAIDDGTGEGFYWHD